jgi:histidine phosphotransferase ChpT
MKKVNNEGNKIIMDMREAQLLCSRLCHDLVGPVGAVNAGLELFAEMDGGEDALSMVGHSAKQMGARLGFYRMAFGLAGAETAVMGQVRKLAREFMTDSKVELDWPADDTDKGLFPANACKLILSMVMIGIECLPRGGSLAVRVALLPEGFGAAVIATGDRAQIKEATQRAMLACVQFEELSAHNIHGRWASLLAEDMGAAIETSGDEPGMVNLAVVLPGPLD